jgi:hypothetical protein
MFVYDIFIFVYVIYSGEFESDMFAQKYILITAGILFKGFKLVNKIYQI